MMIALGIIAVIVLVFCIVVVRGAPYVPSLAKHADRALSELYSVTKKDVLVDLGSGDGVVLRLAARRGARAIGYELNPILVLVSKVLSRRYAAVETRLADFWLVDLPDDVTVVYAFSVTRDMKKLERKMQQTADRVGRPVRLIVFGHTIAERPIEKKIHSHNLYLFTPKPLQ